MKKPAYSLIIPVFNEEGTVASLFYSLRDVMDGLKDEYEIIFINDGSKDSTLERLNALSSKNKSLHIINLPVNKGRGKALEEGFRNAKGEIIITLDGDLQNDPADIPKLISTINLGFDLVCGWRFRRYDTMIKIIKSKIGNFLQRAITHIDIHDISCSMRAYRKEAITCIHFQTKYDFTLLPYIISKKPKVKITEVKIRDNRRRFGKTKYKHLPTIIGTVYAYLKLLLRKKNVSRIRIDG